MQPLVFEVLCYWFGLGVAPLGSIRRVATALWAVSLLGVAKSSGIPFDVFIPG